MSLDLPPLVWFGAFLLLYVFFREAEQLCFCSIFAHFLKAGNSFPLLDYSSFYGTRLWMLVMRKRGLKPPPRSLLSVKNDVIGQL